MNESEENNNAKEPSAFEVISKRLEFQGQTRDELINNIVKSLNRIKLDGPSVEDRELRKVAEPSKSIDFVGYLHREMEKTDIAIKQLEYINLKLYQII